MKVKPIKVDGIRKAKNSVNNHYSYLKRYAKDSSVDSIYSRRKEGVRYGKD